MEHAISFMDKVFSKGHAEKAPALKDGEECWFLPIFGVYHAKKQNQILMVFDSSAVFQGHSLNSALLSGPDLTNSLHGILLRFRKEKVAVTSDIEQMFHSFKIREDHRNFVRFIWFTDNDPDLPLMEYRMCVHLFGNSPSPAVATYCLRQCVKIKECDPRVREFVNRNFYVDDGLASYPTEDEALEILKKTQTTLKEEGNLRFHKFASNSSYIMDVLPPGDRAKDLSDVDLHLNAAPLQRSLGLMWNVMSDAFTYQFVPRVRDPPLTKRGILSCLNSLYDPLGFIAPVILQGRFLFREVINLPVGWDDMVPLNIANGRKTLCNTLHYLSSLQISRTIVPTSLGEDTRKEIHFSDASERAVCAVAYLRVIPNDNASMQVGFLMGKSKLSPQHGQTIPRLELCAAVLCTELAAFVLKHIDTTIHEVKFYTDSRIVLGYIYNQTKRFNTYVANRVQRIRQHSAPDQWNYISTEENPANVGSRGILANELPQSMWLQGPVCLQHSYLSEKEDFPLIDPEKDSEIRNTNVVVQKTCFNAHEVYNRIDRFSSWTSLVRAITVLRKAVMRKLGLPLLDPVHVNSATELFLVKLCQNETFSAEITNLVNDKPVSKDSSLRYLDPYLHDGIIRLGGRIRTGDALSDEHGPIIIQGKTYLARLLVLHCHGVVKHQGRHLTEGAVRSSGYWVIGGKRLISSVIHSCVTCRKLRGKLEHQKMGNLPSPPFTYVGVDTFRPWEIVTRKTRGGSANSKRWAILFTCLTSRVVHIELVEDMSSPTFINALRRFIAIRGKVREFRSDRGTNFVGSTDALRITAVNIESSPVKKFLTDSGCSWIFNPPHSSHMGGVWERMIGIARRILDSMLLKETKKNLTHDVLNTLMAEVTAIINSRPIVPVSTDPSQPSVLSPYTLLTQKTELDVGPFEPFDTKDMYKSHWKCIQILADQFWRKWRSQYLQLLQSRRKWVDSRNNLTEGDVVLLKDQDSVRNEWPMGIVVRVFPGKSA
ncbi:uncharacterized protein LOC134241304 [Saccostrea cucullata]|uniref:uncharacterized protein LOC134241304 n=1 Tax=Saccostrea cuccullata TaxID=36930 RepID=UPI002ED0A743